MARTKPALLTIAIVVSAIACSNAGATVEYTVPECGVSFRYPASWILDTEGGDIIILRRGPWIGDVAAESILLQCGFGTFEEGAASIGFEQEGAEWSVDLGAGRHRAVRLPDGLEGWARGRCYDGENQVYSACDAYARYRWTDGRWLGASGTHDDFVRSLVAGAAFRELPAVMALRSR